MTQWMNAELIVYLPILLVLLGLTFSICVDSYLGKKNRRVMLVITALILSLVVQNFFEYLFGLDSAFYRARMLSGIFGYSVRPVILLLFFYIVGRPRRMRPFWILVGLNALIHLTALFSDVCFTIDTNNHFIRGPLGFSCHIVSGALLLCLVIWTVREYNRIRKSEMSIPLLNALLVVAAVVADSVANGGDLPISYLTIAVVCSSLFYYIWLHLQFVREHEQALQAEQRIRIMVSQIQPHFLYNTIATIRALCRSDPDKASEVAGNFGRYLRDNIDSLDTEGLIPVEKELEHTRLYAEIEMVRFENVRVEYEIGDRDFSLPPLTIQPLVENAIRHGVRIREAGLVRVRTRYAEGVHELVIEDNGVGFDVSTIETADRSHIGVRNVRERVEKLCGGTFSMESRIGEGTKVVIRIPERSAVR